MARVLVNGGLASSVFCKQQKPLLRHSIRSPSKGVVTAVALNGQKQQASSGEQYYYTLGVRPGSSKQDIKRAYHQLALKYHPDVCKGDHCVPKFRQISTAYEELQSAINPSSIQEGELVEDYLSDEDEESEWRGGWEGAWVL